MSQYFNNFPVIRYDINRAKLSSRDSVTNIFFRIGIIKEIMRNISSYYDYTIRDGDKPETLAEKIYGNPESHWIILYANDVIDPHYDWPLDNLSFEKYIADKYKTTARRSGVANAVSWAKSNYILYEKVIKRTNEYQDTTYETRLQIDQSNVASVMASTAPYDTYNSLAAVGSFDNFTISNRLVSETISSERISYYDYEIRENEKKRNIKIIKKDYYPRIISEFNNLTLNADVTQPFIRRFT